KQPIPGTSWRINLCRQQKPKNEISTWSGLVGAFHQPAQFGAAVFQPGVPAVRDLNLTLLSTGDYCFAATLRHVYPTPRSLLLRGLATAMAGQKSNQQ